MALNVDRAVELLVERGEVRLHSENSVTIVLTGLRRLEPAVFTGKGPRIRLSPDQAWEARLMVDDQAYAIGIEIAGCAVGEICATVTANAVSVAEAQPRRATRVPLTAPASVRPVAAAVERRGPLPGSLVNLSAGGCELVTEAELVPGDLVDVEARVLEHRLEARCQVVHARADRGTGTVAAGLRFIQQQPAVAGLLQTLAANPTIEPLAGKAPRRGLFRRRAA